MGRAQARATAAPAAGFPEMHLEGWLYPLLFLTGLGAGFVDAIAGGGGLITVPVLLAIGLPPPVALGTNKLQSACGTALATWNYARHGLLRWPELRLGLAPTLVGAAAGAWAVTQVSPAFLRPAIPVLLLVIAAHTWLKPDLGAEPRPARLSPTWFALLAGAALGFYDGFFGPGTGSFWTIACVTLLGLDLLRATAHTKAMNLMSNLASLAVFAAAGQVDLRVGLTMAAGQIIGGKLGSGLAVKNGAKVIRPAFLTVVLALTAKLLWDNFR